MPREALLRSRLKQLPQGRIALDPTQSFTVRFGRAASTPENHHKIGMTSSLDRTCTGVNSCQSNPASPWKSSLAQTVNREGSSGILAPSLDVRLGRGSPIGTVMSLERCETTSGLILYGWTSRRDTSIDCRFPKATTRRAGPCHLRTRRSPHRHVRASS